MPHLKEELDNNYNHRLDQITPSMIRSFSRSINDIPGLISLNVGEPGFNTPEHIKQAAVDSIVGNKSHYSPQNGWLQLRQSVADFIKASYHLDYDSEKEVVITDGATEGLSSTFIATVNPGDQVLIPMPAYPAYTSLVEMAGGQAIPMDTSDDQFKLTPKMLEQTISEYPNAKEIILNYPTNPTGVEYTEVELKALADVLKKHDILVVADEIYAELTYGMPHVSIAEFLPEQTILINGVSKSHAMTGYRLGYICGPREIIKHINTVHGYLVTSPPNPSQFAAQEALDNGRHDTEPMREEYQKRRDLVSEQMRKAGFEIISPDGAFYIFAKIPPQFPRDSIKFARRLAKEAKVGTTPGIAFGKAGEGYLRISYAADMDQIKEAMKRITAFIGANN